MDNEEEEDDGQEIGIQQDEETKQKQSEEAATQQTTEGAASTAEGTGHQGGRKRKDYGAAYNPNYKKGPWRKGQYPEGTDNKNKTPAIARTKNERGDYVVTSFAIPDRVALNKVEKVTFFTSNVILVSRRRKSVKKFVVLAHSMLTVTRKRRKVLPQPKSNSQPPLRKLRQARKSRRNQ